MLRERRPFTRALRAVSCTNAMLSGRSAVTAAAPVPRLPRSSVLPSVGSRVRSLPSQVLPDSCLGSPDCVNRCVQVLAHLSDAGLRPRWRWAGSSGRRASGSIFWLCRLSARVWCAANPATQAGRRPPLAGRVALLLDWILVIAPGYCSPQPRV